MKHLATDALCVAKFVVLCVLLAIGDLTACLLALVMFLYIVASAHDNPEVWRNFYSDTLHVISKFLK